MRINIPSRLVIVFAGMAEKGASRAPTHRPTSFFWRTSFSVGDSVLETARQVGAVRLACIKNGGKDLCGYHFPSFLVYQAGKKMHKRRRIDTEHLLGDACWPHRAELWLSARTSEKHHCHGRMSQRREWACQSLKGVKADQWSLARTRKEDHDKHKTSDPVPTASGPAKPRSPSAAAVVDKRSVETETRNQMKSRQAT